MEFVNNSRCQFQPKSIVDPAMKPKPRPWTADEHRRFAETCFEGMARVIQATGKPLFALALILVLLTGTPLHLLPILRSFLW
jgi:hypothetical protein